MLRAFEEDLDVARVRNEFYLSELLSRGVKVLLYAGKTDLMCNWVGNVEMVDELEWVGMKGWKEAEWRDWMPSYQWREGGKKEAQWKEAFPSASVSSQEKRIAQRAGQVKTFGSLTFLAIEDAGHMVRLFLPSRLRAQGYAAELHSY
jgi:carboxypeptidase C (cathepsin A)